MCLFSGLVFGQAALGEVMGTVVKADSSGPVSFARVFIEDNGVKYQANTDLDGSFKISGIPAGDRFMTIYFDVDTMKMEVRIPMDGINRLGEIYFESKVLTLEALTASAKAGGLKLIDGDLPVKQITAEEIAQSPIKFDQKQLIATMSSEIRITEDGELVFRGARKGDMIYMMDGVKTTEVNNVPSCSIGRMMVYTGAIPAKYGDTTGGVVVMETKSYFDLYNAWVSQQIKAGKM